MKSPFFLSATCAVAVATLLTSCDGSDETQRWQQEVLLKEATAQTGMPAIKNFRERKIVKMLLEKRDQSNLNTYTYLYAEATGEVKFFCNSVGFPIPYSVQYTNPEKLTNSSTTLPQADPSGLFLPSSAEATWVMCKNPSGGVEPTYVEPKVIVHTYKI